MDRAQQTAINRDRRKSVHVLGSLFVQAEFSFSFPSSPKGRNSKAHVRRLVSRFVYAWRSVLRYYVLAKVCALNSYCWTNKSNIGDTYTSLACSAKRQNLKYQSFTGKGLQVSSICSFGRIKPVFCNTLC